VNVWLGLGLAYLIGAIPTSYLVGRLVAGIDLREHGSRNLGATNLYRTLGGKYAYPAGVFDAAKGALAVLVFAPRIGGGAWMELAVGAAAIIGHVFPVYLGFRGGKGVATAAGAMLAVAPLPMLVSILTWLVLLLATRIMSLASLAGALVFPVAAVLLAPGRTPVQVVGAAVAAFIVFTHRANIRRLLQGTEPRLSRSVRAGNGSEVAKGDGG